MNQPTLASIPGILFRAIIRLFARMILVIASAVLLIGAALALFSLFLATWKTSRTKKVQLAVDIVLLATEIAKDRRRMSKTDSE